MASERIEDVSAPESVLAGVADELPMQTFDALKKHPETTRSVLRREPAAHRSSTGTLSELRYEVVKHLGWLGYAIRFSVTALPEFAA